MSEYIVIIFIAFAGFLLSNYLSHTKKKKTEHMTCPFRGNCSAVIESRWSKFFGIPVEKLGMLYYVFIAVGYGLLIFMDGLDFLGPLLLLASTFALVFSVYLTFIQMVTLRKLCTWCLLSATFCLAIFLLSLFSSLVTVIPFLADYREAIIIIHVLSMALGLSAATFSDIFFFRFLKDFSISKKEASILNTFSEVIWLALGIIVMTGLALFLPDIARLGVSEKFWLKMFIVGVIFVNGAFLNLFVAPRFLSIKFGEPHKHQRGELHKTRRLAFILGPISIISWYSAFVLGAMRELPYSFEEGLVVYALLIAGGIMIGLVSEWELDNKAKKNP